MTAPAHRLQFFDTVITGWPATAIIFLIILSIFAYGFYLGRRRS